MVKMKGVINHGDLGLYGYHKAGLLVNAFGMIYIDMYISRHHSQGIGYEYMCSASRHTRGLHRVKHNASKEPLMSHRHAPCFVHASRNIPYCTSHHQLRLYSVPHSLLIQCIKLSRGFMYTSSLKSNFSRFNSRREATTITCNICPQSCLKANLQCLCLISILLHYALTSR